MDSYPTYSYKYKKTANAAATYSHIHPFQHTDTLQHANTFQYTHTFGHTYAIKYSYSYEHTISGCCSAKYECLCYL
jgi:hypothetical protein